MSTPGEAVFVRVRGNSQLPPQTVNAIRFLVEAIEQAGRTPGEEIAIALNRPVLSDADKARLEAAMKKAQETVSKP